MSHFLNSCLSLFFMAKKGNILVFFNTNFSTFHKIKPSTYFRNLRHASLVKYVIYQDEIIGISVPNFQNPF